MELLGQRSYTFLRLSTRELCKLDYMFYFRKYDKSEMTDDPNSQKFTALKVWGNQIWLVWMEHNVMD